MESIDFITELRGPLVTLLTFFSPKLISFLGVVFLFVYPGHLFFSYFSHCRLILSSLSLRNVRAKSSLAIFCI